MRHAIVDTAASPAIVVNVIDYADDIDGETPPGFAPPLVAYRDDAGAASIGFAYVEGEFVDPAPLPEPASDPAFLARDLLALLTPDNYTAIQTAIAGSAALGLLWASLLAQGDAPIVTTADRFVAGWAGLVGALGAERCGELAAALGFEPPA